MIKVKLPTISITSKRNLTFNLLDPNQIRKMNVLLDITCVYYFDLLFMLLVQERMKDLLFVLFEMRDVLFVTKGKVFSNLTREREM